MRFHLRYILTLVLFVCSISFGYSQVGINTTTPLSTLDINGNLNVKEIGIANVNVSGSGVFNGGSSGSATPISDGVYLSLNPTSGSPEFILPDAVTVPGRIYIMRNISTSAAAKIYTFGGSFYAKDSSSATTAPLTLPTTGTLKSVIVISDGQNWTYFF
ncbi:hypothetical protein [Flavobacterium aciduliphilum]|uniref:Uncharacterized protein n=1 Tax=Flavobacterium aciduliphilum TaxID=1101402 RepID=A0A328YH24_9FLAO|nr:hypothetical protein [Flavobacterium aciduliphilum]RAR72624.1 hypothetical protein CLV55_105195 [Flavobacterium aciduliphilum]